MIAIEQKFLSIPEVAVIVGLSTHTVRNHFKQNLIEGAFRLANGHIRIPVDSEYFGNGKKQKPVPEPRKFKTNYERAMYLKDYKGGM